MKMKKALKRLQRVEDLLDDVLQQFEASPQEVRNLLDGAKANVSSAAVALTSEAPAKPDKAGLKLAKKPVVAATKKARTAAKSA